MRAEAHAKVEGAAKLLSIGVNREESADKALTLMESIWAGGKEVCA